MTKSSIEAHRSSYVIKIGQVEAQRMRTLPLPQLRPPAFSQRYISYTMDSDTYYALSVGEIGEINNCISHGGECSIPDRVKPSEGVLRFAFFQRNETTSEIGRIFSFRFQDGVESAVVIKGFKGRFASAGATESRQGDFVVFKSTGAGYLYFSEVPSWQKYAALLAPSWVASEPSDGVKEVARTIFRKDMQPHELVRVAQEWISKNITYEYRPQTVNDMHRPSQAAVVVANRKGDCKGMSMLLIALLKEAGMESDPALTRLGDKAKMYMMDPLVPMPSYFDHVLVYVPALNRYYDPTVRSDQLDVEISEYMGFALNINSGQLVCLDQGDCKGIPPYRLAN